MTSRQSFFFLHCDDLHSVGSVLKMPMCDVSGGREWIKPATTSLDTNVCS